jgi:uncharacterized membrane protein (DUF106 family)
MAILGFLFSPLMTLNPLLAILIFSGIVSILINLSYKFLMDQKKAKEIKARTNELQARMKELQKKNDMDGMNAMMGEAMKNNSEQMKLMLKPMMFSLIIGILTLPWLNENYSKLVINLPGTIPFIGSMMPFGWLGWYIICSVPFILVTRKLFGLEF